MSEVIRKAVWRGVAVAAVLMAFPLAWRFGLMIGELTTPPPAHPVPSGEMWMDPR